MKWLFRRRLLQRLNRLTDGRAEPLRVCGANGSLRTLLLQEIQRELARPVVVVASSAARGRQLCSALNGGTSACQGGAVLLRRGDSTPYLEVGLNRFVEMERMAALWRTLRDPALRFVVLTPAALSRRCMPRAAFEAATQRVVCGQELPSGFSERLVTAGYFRVPMVEEPGSFAVRGGIVDVFSPSHEFPLRLDLFGTEVDELRTFDPHTQRSKGSLNEAWIPPVTEAICTPEALRRLTRELHSLAGELEVPTGQVSRLLEELKTRRFHPAQGAVLAAFHEQLVPVDDYIDPRALWVVEEPAALEQALELESGAHQTAFDASRKKGRVVFPVAALSRGPAESSDALRAHVQLVFDASPASASRKAPLVIEPRWHTELRAELAQSRGEERALRPFLAALERWFEEGQTLVLCARDAAGVSRVEGVLALYDIECTRWEGPFGFERLSELHKYPGVVHVFESEMGDGFTLAELNLVLVSEADLFGPRLGARGGTADMTHSGGVLAAFEDLEAGDFVVHLEHGISRYDGLVRLNVQGEEGEFLSLGFQGEDRLYLPVQHFDRVHRYVGADGGDGKPPRLDRLGGTRWERTRRRVRENLLEMAEELVGREAARQARGGYAFSLPGANFRAFEASFPYTETPGQRRAIEEVLEDMVSPSAMDRLICGDVGFGKTEVAIRAAFVAAMGCRQVAVLVPTTVLADQHLLTFEERLGGYPIAIDSLSRYKNTSQSQSVVERLLDGRLDVVIGTQRLLSGDVAFRDLGLVIIDEEHRFGVKAKEKLKELRASVDVLSMTATPIPRTLQLALYGMRDLSVIATPPSNRLAVNTVVERENDDLVVHAIHRELARGGQVFLVHNRVQSIERRAKEIRELLPRAHVAVAHGQMAERQLERVMRDFARGRVQVLVCTTIIESGLDIPNANTLIVDRADRLGLADLYQLRGRVGRSSVAATAYLLVPEPTALSPVAARRVGVLQRHSRLGSGFQVALRDLEIRGAGNLLGKQQHGSIEAVGYDLYAELLAEAMAKVRGEEVAPVLEAEVRLGLPAFIPESFCADTGLRLAIYKRLAGTQSVEEIGELHGELADRFGSLPAEVENLVFAASARLQAKAVGLEKLEWTRDKVVVHVHPEGIMPQQALIELVSTEGSPWRLTRDGRGLVRERRTQGEQGLRKEQASLFEALHALLAGDSGPALAC